MVSSADAGRLTSFNEELKILEAQHPDIAVKDLLDTKRRSPKKRLSLKRPINSRIV